MNHKIELNTNKKKSLLKKKYSVFNKLKVKQIQNKFLSFHELHFF